MVLMGWQEEKENTDTPMHKTVDKKATVLGYLCTSLGGAVHMTTGKQGSFFH